MRTRQSIYPDAARGRVLTVDPASRRVEVGLKDGSTLQVEVVETGPFFRWPAEGELWTIKRHNYTWVLNSIVDEQYKEGTQIEDLQAGEALIYSDVVRTPTTQLATLEDFAAIGDPSKIAFTNVAQTFIKKQTFAPDTDTNAIDLRVNAVQTTAIFRVRNNADTATLVAINENGKLTALGGLDSGSEPTICGDATANTHAINRQTGDARYSAIAHDDDTTNIHGIADTSLIAFVNAAQTFLRQQTIQPDTDIAPLRLRKNNDASSANYLTGQDDAGTTTIWEVDQNGKGKFAGLDAGDEVISGVADATASGHAISRSFGDTRYVHQTLVTTKGDLLVATGPDTLTRHGVGATDGYVLITDSSHAHGLRWAEPAGVDSAAPTGPAGGVLAGVYPDPGFAVDMATQAELNTVQGNVNAVQGNLDTHGSDTTAIHGITDTTKLAEINVAQTFVKQQTIKPDSDVTALRLRPDTDIGGADYIAGLDAAGTTIIWQITKAGKGQFSGLDAGGQTITSVADATGAQQAVNRQFGDARYIMQSVVNNKGDLLVAMANDTIGIETIGANGQVLTADSAQANGVKWAAPVGGGGGGGDAFLGSAQTFTKQQTIDPDTDITPLRLIPQAAGGADYLQGRNAANTTNTWLINANGKGLFFGVDAQGEQVIGVGDATGALHAINRQTGDARYAGISAAALLAQAQTFTKQQTIDTDTDVAPLRLIPHPGGLADYIRGRNAADTADVWRVSPAGKGFFVGLNAGGQVIENLADPGSGNQAVTVTYADGRYMRPTTVDAKGDLLVGTADNTVARQAVGTNGQVLTADSTLANGVKWASVAGGGGGDAFLGNVQTFTKQQTFDPDTDTAPIRIVPAVGGSADYIQGRNATNTGNTWQIGSIGKGSFFGLDAQAEQITGVGDATGPLHAVNRQYADAHYANITAAALLAQAQIFTKQQTVQPDTDIAALRVVPQAAGTGDYLQGRNSTNTANIWWVGPAGKASFFGLSALDQQITNVADPTNLTHAINLQTGDARYIQDALVDVKGDLIVATATDTVARQAVGANGQVLIADSTQATGVRWGVSSGGVDPSTIDAKGDLLIGSADNTADNLTVGTNGQVLTADSTQILGVKWATVGTGGTPTGPAGGVLSGTYPDPGFAVDMATQAELNTHESDTTAVHGITDTAQVALRNTTNTFTLKQTIAPTTDITSFEIRRGTDTAPTNAPFRIRNAADSATLASISATGLVTGIGLDASTQKLTNLLAGTVATDGINKGQLDAHEADTTNVHGIADTSALATTANVTAAVGTHEGDTLAVHGITDTTLLARLNSAQTWTKQQTMQPDSDVAPLRLRKTSDAGTANFLVGQNAAGSATIWEVNQNGRGSFVGLDAGSQVISSVGDATSATHAVNRQFGDSRYARLATSGTHATRGAPGIAGRTYFETNTHVNYLDDGTAWVAISPGFVRKTANETVNNSATLQNDDELFFPIEAGETWWVEAFLRLGSANTTADWKFGWSGPTGAAANWGIVGTPAITGASWSAVDPATTPPAERDLTQTVSIGAGTATNANLMGRFAATSTAGTITLQWAQDTATVVNSNVLTHSWLRITRMI